MMKYILIGLISIGVILFILFKIIIPIFQSSIPKQNIQDLDELEEQTKETLNQYNQTKKTVEETKEKITQISNQFNHK